MIVQKGGIQRIKQAIEAHMSVGMIVSEAFQSLANLSRSAQVRFKSYTHIPTFFGIDVCPFSSCTIRRYYVSDKVSLLSISLFLSYSLLLSLHFSCSSHFTSPCRPSLFRIMRWMALQVVRVAALIIFSLSSRVRALSLSRSLARSTSILPSPLLIS